VKFSGLIASDLLYDLDSSGHVNLDDGGLLYDC
jgi:hypothetical protein